MLLMGGCLLTSCQKDKMGEGNDEELITTINLKFTPVGGGTTKTYSFNDPDGPGGVNPTQDMIVLNKTTTYNVEVELFNNSANPPENITTEVANEAEAHRFYYETTGGVAITNLSNDPEGKPLGITSDWTTGTPGSGIAKITLRHYIGTPPDKQQADPVNSPKSGTDIEVIFNTTIQ